MTEDQAHRANPLPPTNRGGKDSYDIIELSFTDDQVASMNAFQKSKFVHPFTCGYELGPHHSYEESILEADNNGWHCKKCSYIQRWAYRFMTNWEWKILEIP
jgi:hypothetical protein